jgi:hypothetical protein
MRDIFREFLKGAAYTLGGISALWLLQWIPPINNLCSALILYLAAREKLLLTIRLAGWMIGVLSIGLAVWLSWHERRNSKKRQIVISV